MIVDQNDLVDKPSSHNMFIEEENVNKTPSRNKKGSKQEDKQEPRKKKSSIPPIKLPY